MTDILLRVERASDERFGEKLGASADQPGADALARMLEHRSHRRYAARIVNPQLLRLLFACALSAPSKSDLQQADIVHVSNSATRTAIADDAVPPVSGGFWYLVRGANACQAKGSWGFQGIQGAPGVERSSTSCP